MGGGGAREARLSQGSPESRVIAEIGKGKTLPLINADNADRNKALEMLELCTKLGSPWDGGK